MLSHLHVLKDATPPKIEKGIRDSIGRKMKMTLKKMIKLEIGKGNQADGKVLTLTPDRCFILGMKSPFKVEINFHFLDIKSMESPSPDRLNISVSNGKTYCMHMIGSDDADHIIGRVALSLRTIFPGVSLSRIMKASLEPLSRQKVIQSMLNQADLSESGPCGNFSIMYECMCNHLGLPVREEVGWDVDTIYLSQNCKDLNLKDFDVPDHKDYMPILSVLMYSNWFEGLTVRNIKLSGDVLDVILKVVRTSIALRSLVLDGVGLKGETAYKLSQEFVENKECRIHTLDLCNNPLEDRAAMHLSNCLPTLSQGGGLRSLKLDRAGLAAKGVSGLCQSLRSSPIITRSLTCLSLSDNSIKGEDASGLYQYLSTPNNLRHLDMSGTDCAVEIYISAMSKGCVEKLQTINLSRNFFYGRGITARPPQYLGEEYTGNRKNKDTALPNTFQEYFKTTKALQSIDLSGMKVPHEAVKQLMDGLRQNFAEGLGVYVNLSSAELRAQGAQVIGAVVGQLTNLTGLDLSDNGLDSDLAKLLPWVQQNTSIRELRLGRNFNGIKPKHMKAVMDSIVELVQEEGSQVESLYLNDSKLKEWSTVILGCLGSNTSLRTLDISGNMMGDTGARVLAKSLQINSKLKVILMDKNFLSATGFHEIAVALEKNFTVRYMPYPVNDAVTAMKSQSERTQSSLAKIQDLLLRNANTNKNPNDQQFRLQQAVSSTAQEVLDKVAGKVDDTINALELLEASSSCTDVVIKAKGLVKDAKSSKQLLTDIYGLGMDMTSGDHSNLKAKLNGMAKDMDKMVQTHIKNTVQAMKKSAESQCPHIFQDIHRELDERSAEKSHFPENFVKDRVITHTSQEIINKVSELNLSVATLISEKVADTLLTALSQCNTTLTEQLKKKKQEQAAAREQLRSKTEESKKENDVTEDKPTPPTEPEPEREPELEPEPQVEVRSEADAKVDEKPKATDNILPAMRKERAASIAKRKQRPNSSLALDLEFKKKVDDQPTPPRSTSPIPEIVTEQTTVEVSVDKVETDKEVTETEEKIVEPEDTSEPPKEPELPKEEKEETVEEEEQSDDSMVAVESVKESKDEVTDGNAKVVEDADDALPELPTATKKLEHVTKGRARPTRRVQRKPVVKASETDKDVDNFFNATVSSTDFDKVPTLAEEQKEAAKEKTPKKPMGFGFPGMGQITPDMLRRKKKSSVTEDKDKEPASESPKDSAKEDGENHTEEAEEPPKPEPAKRRPPGAMGLPGMGMGFGGNVLAEMKLKKLNKNKNGEAGSEKTENGKHDSDQPALPFGPGMLKKRNVPTSPPADKKEEANSNHNNNKSSSVKSDRWKSRSFGKADKPQISTKPTSIKPLLPGKPSLPSKPGRGNPPPLPAKPKPPLRPDSDSRGSRSRPMSEFVDPKHVPTNVKLRATSWGKKTSKDEN